MTEELHKEIMKKSRLRNIFLKDKTKTKRKGYKTQRNFCKKTSQNFQNVTFRHSQYEKRYLQQNILEDHFASLCTKDVKRQNN